MISLRVEPYCHECNDFEAHVVHIYANKQIYNTIVKCEHCEKCAKIAKHIKEAMGNDVQRENNA